MVVRIKVDLGFPKLPPGVWYKGGVARAALIKAVRGEKIRVRDVDLVVFSELEDEEVGKVVELFEEAGYKVDLETHEGNPEDWVVNEPDLDIRITEKGIESLYVF